MTARNVSLRYAVVLFVSLALFGSAGCAKILKQAALRHPVVKKVFSVPPMDTTVSGEAWTTSVGEESNRITVLHLTGTNYYSLGYHEGKLLGPEIKENLDSVFAALDKVMVE